MRQRLMPAEDLLHDHIERTVGDLPGADEILQALKISCRIIEPVDVIEAQPLQLAVRDQVSDQTVDRRESIGILDTKPGKRADIEETPIVDLGRRQAPMGKPKMLALQQTMQIGGCMRAWWLERLEPAFDHIAGSGPGERSLQASRLLTPARAFLERSRKLEKPPACRASVGLCGGNDG